MGAEGGWFNKAAHAVRTGVAAGMLLHSGGSVEAAGKHVSKQTWEPSLEQVLPQPHSISKEQFARANNLSEEIALLTQKLAWGNEYGKALRDPYLTKNTLGDIINEISVASVKLQKANVATDIGIKHYLEGNRSKALTQIGMFDGEGGYSVCNGTFVRVSGDTDYVYFVTADHCQKGQLTIQIGEKIYSAENFITAPNGEDVTVLQLPKEASSETIPLEEWEDDSFLHGQVAIIDSIEVTGKRIVYPTMYIKMTLETYRVMFLSEPDLDDPYTRTVLDGYWFVLPPRLGEPRQDATGHIMRNEDGSPVLQFQGQSGNSIRVLIPGMGSFFGGDFSQGSTRQAYAKECRDAKRNICSTVGFATGIASIKDAIQAAKEKGVLVSEDNF